MFWRPVWAYVAPIAAALAAPLKEGQTCPTHGLHNLHERDERMKPKESLRIQFREATRPITLPVTKLGGAPVWIDAPQWPLSRITRQPMQFIAQVALDARVFPNAMARMAYVFMTNHDVDNFDPDAGENAVILQPGHTRVPHQPLLKGPGLYTVRADPVTDDTVQVPTELATELLVQSEPAYVSEAEQAAWTSAERIQYLKALEGNKIGGTPAFVQNERFPFRDWRLLLQLDSNAVPFNVGFGDGGVGYAIANADCTEARFFWQGA